MTVGQISEKEFGVVVVVVVAAAAAAVAVVVAAVDHTRMTGGLQKTVAWKLKYHHTEVFCSLSLLVFPVFSLAGRL